jgi:hypothetical protein
VRKWLPITQSISHHSSPHAAGAAGAAGAGVSFPSMHRLMILVLPLFFSSQTSRPGLFLYTICHTPPVLHYFVLQQDTTQIITSPSFDVLECNVPTACEVPNDM